MPLKELLFPSAGLIFALLTIIQITPIKVNPWSAIGGVVGKVVNGEVSKELREIKTAQEAYQRKLDYHIANMNRQRILQFNLELLQGVEHTREDYIEILACIDIYNQFCVDHPEYPNNRAEHAISNIGKNYDLRLEKRDFA